MARQSRRLVVLTEGILAVFGLERVYVDGPIGRLRSDVFVEGVPGNALDVVAVLCYLSNEGS